MRMVRLQTEDGKVISMDLEVAKQSAKVKSLMEGLGEEETCRKPIFVPNLKGWAVERVFLWCNHHKAGPHKKGEDCISFCCQDFCAYDYRTMNVSVDEWFQVVMAANVLGVKELVKLLRTKTYFKRRWKSLAQLNARLSMLNFFTPE